MSQPKHMRLDQLLVEQGFFKSRQQAHFAIISGHVLLNGSVSDKPGRQVPSNSAISIKEKLPYVSRGGLKLKAALETFQINVKDKTAIDIGSSTGGFTDCLLQHGAILVYAVDVGYGQLDLSLRNNPKVILMEKTNARYLLPDNFKNAPDIITVDVSFISLDKIIPVLKSIIKKGGDIIALIKPQFEAGPKKAKKGVVKDPAVHEEVIEKIKNISTDAGFAIKDVIPSPILGPSGNKEFLIWIKND